ncbi:hypothetical protein BDB01DRAFT_836893 [Pilobolus umbonatus]|nr:hypothetical protein BDB01DRAFT_836893 [Pilobolus umbonatus]
MDSLPEEILQLVIEDFDKREYRRCLTVNKKWYSVFIKLLYAKIKIDDANQLRLFINSLSLYPGYARIKYFIRELDMFSLDKEEQYRGEDICYFREMNTSMDSNQNAPGHNHEPRLPNFYSSREIIIRSEDDLFSFEEVMPPIYNDLHHFRIDDPYIYNDECTEFIKTLSTMTNLNRLVFCHYPQLRKEQLHSYSTNLDDLKQTTFYQILSLCSSLTSLKYTCVTLCSNSCSKLSNQQFPKIKQLELVVKRFYLNDSIYIKNIFTELTELTLRIEALPNTNTHTFDALMKMKTLATLRIIPGKNIEVTYMHFLLWWSSMSSESIPEKNITYGATFITDDSFPAEIVIQNFPESKSREVTYMYIMRQIFHLNHPIGFLPTIKKDLSKLDIYGPSGDTLKRFSHSLLHKFEKILSTPMENLRSVSIDKYIVKESTFKSLEVMFPKLQSINLSKVQFKISDTDSSSTEIWLPNKNLECLKLIAMQQKVVVTREDRGSPVLSWYYCDKTEKTVEVEGYGIASTIKQLQSNQHLIILKSNTLEHVQF